MASPPTSSNTFAVRFLWTWLFATALFCTLAYGYFLKVDLAKIGIFTVGFYGVLTFLHLLAQIYFASLNQRKIAALSDAAKKHSYIPTVGIMVVGYREDPEYFNKCLTSLSQMAYPAITKIVVGIDADIQLGDAKDLAMVNVFKQVFPEGTVLSTPGVLSDLHEKASQRIQFLRQIQDAGRIVCFSQAHRGKREAMYTAAKSLIASGCELIYTTDSDSVIDPQVVNQLSLMLFDPKVGAAVGRVEIYNKDNLLTYLLSLRYWFAFNLERAAQSFWGVVICVSGPIGMYRAAAVDKILDRWVNQTFLGEKCTYGDDRHLTNLIMAQGLKVLYNPHAFCLTETPATFERWIVQQTRWSKSFWRELLVNAMSFHKQSPWLTIDMVYHSVFPIFLLISLVWQLYFGTTVSFLIILVTILFGATLKSIWAFALTKQKRMFGFMGYGFIHLLGLLPTKFYALATLWDTRWGTSRNLAHKYPIQLPIWYTLLALGVLVNLSNTKTLQTIHLAENNRQKKVAQQRFPKPLGVNVLVNNTPNGGIGVSATPPTRLAVKNKPSPTSVVKQITVSAQLGLNVRICPALHCQVAHTERYGTDMKVADLQYTEADGYRWVKRADGYYIALGTTDKHQQYVVDTSLYAQAARPLAIGGGEVMGAQSSTHAPQSHYTFSQSAKGVKNAYGGPRLARSSDCDPAYSTICIPKASPGSITCAQIAYRNFPLDFRYDPHNFDRNDNNLGCDTVDYHPVVKTQVPRTGRRSKTCTAPFPGGNPTIFQADRTATDATLYFVPVPDPVDRYYISYGKAPFNDQYGAEYVYDSKPDGAVPYPIHALDAGSDYCFKVRAGNSCEPGDWSNTICVEAPSKLGTEKLVRYKS